MKPKRFRKVVEYDFTTLAGHEYLRDNHILFIIGFSMIPIVGQVFFISWLIGMFVNCKVYYEEIK